MNDGKASPDALPDHPGDVYADSAYRGDHFGKAVIAKGGRPKIVALTCGDAMKPKYGRTLMPGTNRSTAPVDGSRRFSAPGNEAMVYGGCDGEGWQGQEFKSA